MELEGRKELVDTGKSSRTWSVPTVSLRLAVLNVFHGFFGPKVAVFGPKLQFLKQRSATCESRSRPPLLSFSLKICVIVLHTHRYHAPKFQPNPKHHDRVLIFPHFARAACCCLLLAAAAAKPGRSTLDPKKGYKTKTGSTSSVTKHTFFIHFGDPIPLQWDNSTIYLKHCGIYAFDASKKHSLPIWPRFSISLRSWDTGSATPCEDDHVTKKIRPNPSN